MTNRNILVLGGTGYFGKHLVEMLLTNGDNVCIATRGISQIPTGCSFVKFDRKEGNNLLLDCYWDVVYDQSCYSSDCLNGLKNIIANCGQYILTSTQSVYPSGNAINENSIDYDDINRYKNIVNDYGFEKLKAECIVRSLVKKYVFPRFPVVVGVNDPRKRVQDLVRRILKGYICLPVSNPALQILDEFDAAKVLFEIPFKNITGSINIASKDIISAEDLCRMIASRMGVDLKIGRSTYFESSSFDLIKADSKTLLLEKQEAAGFFIKKLRAVMESILIPTTGINRKCRL